MSCAAQNSDLCKAVKQRVHVRRGLHSHGPRMGEARIYNVLDINSVK